MTRKMIRKMLALLLVVLMLCSLCACGEKSKDKDKDEKRNEDHAPTYTSELAKEAIALIEAGDYESAYMLLKDAEDINANKDAVALRDKLVWVPVEWTWEDWVCYYTYDENGLLLKKDVEHLSEDTSLGGFDGNSFDKSYTYDANGNCTSITQNGKTTTYTYDSFGRLQSMHATDDDPTEETVYTYDKSGNVLSKRKTTRYFYKDKIYWEETAFTYDAYGNCLTEHITEHDGDWEKSTYTYDENGRLVSEQYSTEYYQSTKEWTYDSHGRLTMITEKGNDGVNTISKNYTTDGVLISADYKYSDGDRGTCAYIYDENGNCIKEGENILYTYDEEGYCIRKDELNGGSTKRSTQYNSWGKPVSVSEKNNNQIITWKLFYYPNGVPVSVQEIDGLPDDYTENRELSFYTWESHSSEPPFVH